MSSADRLILPAWIITIVAVMVILDLAATLFSPILLAVVMGVVLSPISDAVERTGVPNGISALLTLGAALFFIAALLFLLEPVLTTTINRAPLIWFELRETIQAMQSAMRGLEQTGEQVAEALGSDMTENSESEMVAIPSVTEALLYAPGYAARVMIFIGTLYFFLLSRVGVYEWIENQRFANE